MERHEDECPICMCTLDIFGDDSRRSMSGHEDTSEQNRVPEAGEVSVGAATAQEGRRTRPRPCGERRATLLLSCTHVFHRAVSRGFETVQVPRDFALYRRCSVGGR